MYLQHVINCLPLKLQRLAITQPGCLPCATSCQADCVRHIPSSSCLLLCMRPAASYLLQCMRPEASYLSQGLQHPRSCLPLRLLHAGSCLGAWIVVTVALHALQEGLAQLWLWPPRLQRPVIASRGWLAACLPCRHPVKIMFLQAGICFRSGRFAHQGTLIEHCK